MHAGLARALGYLLAGIAVMAGLATLFFIWFGVQIVYFVLTDDGPGSLGHVGIYIGAFLYPLLAVIFGGITWSARRAARRRLRG